MNKPSRPTCRHALLGIVLGLGMVVPALAEPPTFVGRWALDAPAGTDGGYDTLTIKGERMVWSGRAKSSPKCVEEFVLKGEKPGTVYRDARGTKFVAGSLGSLPTYVFDVGAGACSGADLVRISFPLVYDRRHMELIRYKAGKAVGSQRFSRLDQ